EQAFICYLTCQCSILNYCFAFAGANVECFFETAKYLSGFSSRQVQLVNATKVRKKCCLVHAPNSN
ncbi:MAG: hypothetical protein LBP50_05360, partial [Tannerella sp.]|nr:hypothetical protein [Tannerella sp.]